MEERYEAHRRAVREADTGGGVAVDPEQQVIGAHATQVYHAPGCDLLTGVARAERVLFISNFDALDGGFKPCPRCRPGPR